MKQASQCNVSYGPSFRSLLPTSYICKLTRQVLSISWNYSSKHSSMHHPMMGSGPKVEIPDTHERFRPDILSFYDMLRPPGVLIIIVLLPIPCPRLTNIEHTK
ncbi:hypothetical protein CEXT_608691 [Caerostris extrusa]|uniref:Uncharacterized protein n=1 Tax=Caerostris extrusa TaxID=172846 RepID=A0AAV4R5M4_CAEEX|nr:hypothetical protein CEXT_608691 [Caerostris extrusa]